MLTPTLRAPRSFEDIAYQHDDFVHCPPKGSGLGCDCKCPRPDAKHVDIG